MTQSDTLEPISLRWAGDQLDGVHLASDWRDRLAPSELMTQVVTEFRKQRGGPKGTWRTKVSLRDIPLGQMNEFVDAVRAARRESPMPEVTERRTQHLTSRWRGDQLLLITADPDWLDRAPRQQIADELVETLDMPAAEDGPAVQWLLRMMGEKR